MLIFNQKEDSIKLLFVFGQMEGIYLPKIWRNDINKHYEATAFCRLYNDIKYYQKCLEIGDLDVISYWKSLLIKDDDFNLDYCDLYKERYKEIFTTINQIKQESL